jgi:hypothetical protein
MIFQTDLEINRNVRKVLVRHWIDLGHLLLRTVNGRVLIRGDLDRIAGTKEELLPPIVESMFYTIKRIEGVRAVTAELENWTNQTGVWQRRETDAQKASATLTRTGRGWAGAQQRIDIGGRKRKPEEEQPPPPS